MSAALPFLHDYSKDTSTCPSCGNPAAPGTKRCYRCTGGQGWPADTFLTRAEIIQRREQKKAEFFASRKTARRETLAMVVPGGKP